MEFLEALEGLGGAIKKGALLTMRVLASSGELIVTFFEYLWTRKKQSVPQTQNAHWTVKHDKDNVFIGLSAWITERHFPFPHLFQPDRIAFL